MSKPTDLDTLYRAYQTSGAREDLYAFCEGLHRNLHRVARTLTGDERRATRVVARTLETTARTKGGLPPYPVGSALLMDTLVQQVTAERARAAGPPPPPCPHDPQSLLEATLAGVERRVMEMHLLQDLDSGTIAGGLGLPVEDVDLIIERSIDRMFDTVSTSTPAQGSTQGLPACLPS